LREKLAEANGFVENEQRNRSLMQDNLKKAFMRGVCALNFEAMNILHPSDAAGQIEREMERQMAQAIS
jgi:centrosomal protein POC5